MNPEMKARLRKLSGLKRKCKGLLLCNPDRWANPNFFWLSQASVSGWLWVPLNGRPRLFVRETYREEARGTWAKVEYVTNLDDIFSAIPKTRIGLDVLHTPAQTLGKIRYRIKGLDVSRQMESARAVKTPHEIRQIRKACAVARDVFGTIRLPYRGSEARLRADLEWEIQSRGLEPAFPTIVASGRAIAAPHHAPTTAPIRTPFLVDLGVRFGGYCSDTTRTYGSKYDTLIEAVFEAVEPMLKPGAKAAALDAAARRAMSKHAKHFTTSLGHGIGIAVHELPNIRAASKDVLQAGNVITIEPGIYVPSGIRHENVYLITKRGAEKLTDF